MISMVDVGCPATPTKGYSNPTERNPRGDILGPEYMGNDFRYLDDLTTKAAQSAGLSSIVIQGF
ncbi:hypothetical protein JYT32_00045 [Dehalococcoides mccartyi]|nr:hypothetical protein [Dehalococcoides mccartyi]